MHRTTLELTTDEALSPRGDCIVGVRADKACLQLAPNLKEGIRKGGEVEVIIEVGELMVTIRGRGDPRLSLSDPRSLVIRKSTYTCPRTLMVSSSHAAKDLPREMVRLLRDPHKQGRLLIRLT